MNNRPRNSRDLPIAFPIASSHRRQASAYASQYFTEDAARKNYLNTLCVLVANAYLQMLNFHTNLTEPKRWDASYRLWNEAAELELVGIGCLECRVILEGKQTIFLPPETWCDRIGYLFIEINDSEKEANIIGFLPSSLVGIPEEEIKISGLRSLEEMIDYLSEKAEINNPVAEFTSLQYVYLRNWLDNIYEAEWEPAIRNLSTVIGKKTIKLAGQAYEMQISVTPQDKQLVDVKISIRGQDKWLPRGLKLSVPNGSEIHTETVNDLADLIIIPLEASFGEKFWAKLQIGEYFTEEHFIV